jgi:hypothetical protein
MGIDWACGMLDPAHYPIEELLLTESFAELRTCWIVPCRIRTSIPPEEIRLPQIVALALTQSVAKAVVARCATR